MEREPMENEMEENEMAESEVAEQEALEEDDGATSWEAFDENDAAAAQEALDCDGVKEGETWPLLSFATGRAQRARGLLYTDPHKGALLLVPCRDIHTVGMRYSIDVAFVDGAGQVVEAHRAVGPLCRLRNARAAAVIERFAACGPWFQPGDRIGLSCVRADKKTQWESC